MPPAQELLRLDATEITQRVSSGELSATEVAETYMSWIDQCEPKVSSFIKVTPDWALEVARQIDNSIASGHVAGPLVGVPISIKDVLCTSGVETTCGSKILDGWVPPYTATAVERALSCGAIPVGKTNMDEFAMGSSTENSAFGPTKNPWDTSRVPGGSSGGSAASVASLEAVVSLGSDTGGSIRQPAAFCGVVGLKPTYGRVSRYGLVAFASSLDQVGPFARTVKDAALLYDCISGYDPFDSTSIPADAAEANSTSAVEAIEAISAAGSRPLEGVSIGIVRELMGSAAATDVRQSVTRAYDLLAELGARIDEISLPSFEYALSAYYLIAPAEASSNLARFDGVRYGLRVDAEDATAMMSTTRSAGFGPEVKRRIMLGTYALSAGYYEAFYGTALKVRTLVSRDFQRAFEEFDLLASPTAPTAAFRLGERVSDPLSMYLSDLCTIPANLAGIPAISIPVGLTPAGLPIGLQLMAPVLAEAQLISAAHAAEQALGFEALPLVVDD
jgi:aspartyl-tRNA(Asn)/glutamyl-tRNA(Gln) amidotransferase subunit A